MKILLVNTVIRCSDDGGYNYGLGYIAGVLRHAGHDVTYEILRDEHDIVRLLEVERETPHGLIGFSATTLQFGYLEDIVERLRRISDAFLVCGGIHPTLKPDCLFEIPGLHAIARGEGEYPLAALADALAAGKPHRGLANFWFAGGGDAVRNPVAPLMTDLDALPFPDKECLDYQGLIDRQDGVNRFIFSRGCPFGCTYCCNRALSRVYPNPGAYFRQRSPQKAIEEIERDARAFNFRKIAFDDDTMSLHKTWFCEFFSLYKKTFSYPFTCNVRVGTIDREMFALLKEAGVGDLKVGIEHGAEDFRIRVLRRNTSNRQIEETFERCAEFGIPHSEFVMVGLPFETKKLFLETVKLCRRVSARSKLSIFYPYPGTHLGTVCAEHGWLPRSHRHVERDEATIGYPQFSRREIGLCARAFPVLVRHARIPLWVPLRATLFAHGAARRCVRALRALMRGAARLFTRAAPAR